MVPGRFSGTSLIAITTVPAAGPSRPRRQATPAEQHQYKLLALCIADPKEGQRFLDRLSEEHFSSPVLGKAFVWLREHLSNPLEGLDDSDANLYNAVSRLSALDEGPPTEENLTYFWRMLELDRMESLLRSAQHEGDLERTVELQRERARLKDAIASGAE